MMWSSRRPPPQGRLLEDERDDCSAAVDPRFDRWRENLQINFSNGIPVAPSSASNGMRTNSVSTTLVSTTSLNGGIASGAEQDAATGSNGDKTRSFAALQKFKNSGNDLSDIPDDFVLPTGSVKKGQKYFKKYCRQCHSIYSDNRASPFVQPLGPTMFEVCGRASGMEEGAIRELNENRRASDILWTDAALMNYMKNPRLTAGGPTQMSFPGIRNIQIRADIVHYLHTLNAEQSPELVNFNFNQGRRFR
ncbi:unnamed protein product [Amoebophrya sp. A120]|nr:unnamed protein product [Amoebophrya sp. A120]|eukprot:GSA120T00005807001.1